MYPVCASGRIAIQQDIRSTYIIGSDRPRVWLESMYIHGRQIAFATGPTPHTVTTTHDTFVDHRLYGPVPCGGRPQQRRRRTRDTRPRTSDPTLQADGPPTPRAVVHTPGSGPLVLTLFPPYTTCLPHAAVSPARWDRCARQGLHTLRSPHNYLIGHANRLNSQSEYANQEM